MVFRKRNLVEETYEEGSLMSIQSGLFREDNFQILDQECLDLLESKFDEELYTNSNHDVKNAKLVAFEHFIKFGWLEKRKVSLRGSSKGTITVAELLLKDTYEELESVFAKRCNVSLGTYRKRKSLIDPFFDVTVYKSQLAKDVPSELCQDHFLCVGSKKSLKPNAYFVAREYKALYSDVVGSPLEVFLHYCKTGNLESRFPNNLSTLSRYQSLPVKLVKKLTSLFFDEYFFKEKYSDVKSRDGSLLNYYVSGGWKTCLMANGFDSFAFSESTKQFFLNAGVNPLLVKYIYLSSKLKICSGEGLKEFNDLISDSTGIRYNVKTLRDVKTLRRKFDPNFYIKNNGVRLVKGISAIEHYCRAGWMTNLNPCSSFSNRFYLNENGDVASAKMNPFVHWIKFGNSESRLKSPIEKDILLISGSQLFDKEYYKNTYPSVKGDQIVHFCQHGWKRGFNPSASFSTKEFLRIHANKLKPNQNPFSYWIEHGAFSLEGSQNDGYIQPGEVCDVYISCWLRQKEALHDIIKRFALNITYHGHDVVFVSHSDMIINDPDLRSIRCGFSLFDSSIYNSVTPRKVPSEILNELSDVLKVRALSISDYELANDKEKITRVISRAYTYWLERFKATKPALVLVWGSTCAMSKLHISLCKKLQIKYLVLERGHFPGTLSVEGEGQFAYGSTQYFPNQGDYSDLAYEDIVSWISKRKDKAYANHNIDSGMGEHLKRCLTSSKPNILFIGSNDVGSGTAYARANVAERHSPIFKSSLEAATYLKSLLPLLPGNPNLIVKPHPADRDDYSSLESDDVVVERKYDLNDLISRSDSCVTLTTTAIAQCIIAKKPLVTMAVTDLANYKAAFDCYDKSSILHKVRMSLIGHEIREKQKEGEKYIQDIFRNNLYALSGNGKCVRGINTLSDLVSNRINLQNLFSKEKFRAKKSDTALPLCKYEVVKVNQNVLASSFPGIDVIVPVYSDALITKACIERALMCRSSEATRIIVINDCSPDPNVSQLILELKERSDANLLVYENKHNIGFSGTINRGIEIAGTRDVVLLNSDAFVPNGFDLRLYSIALSDPKIGSISVFSNNAGIFSNPLNGGESLAFEDALAHVDEMDSLASSQNGIDGVEVPVGHGFCLYVRNELVRAIGHFDEYTFGKGYSEEVDFTLRGRCAGFKNALAPGIYVGHIGGVSFGESGNEARVKNREIIKKKYPLYFKEMVSLRRNDPLANFRLK